MIQHEKICNYLDMPFQHISHNVLYKMRREYTRKDTYELIHTIKRKFPGIALRTTLMVGHPGEGEKEFEELVRFVEEVQFDRLGVFTYSEEEGTYSAKNWLDIIPTETKKQRLDTIMGIQHEISKKINNNKIGSLIKVIVDGHERHGYTGRSEFDSPEVDNEVMIETGKKLNIGGFYRVKITRADAYDLIATY
jgi:ribosomal protein S12 methylthiotransferase